MVKRDSLIWPSLEVVDAVESSMLMSSDKSPAIARCCQRKSICCNESLT